MASKRNGKLDYMEQHYALLKKAYIAAYGEENIRPEPEEELQAFEAKFAPIPQAYRWLLLRLGGCHLVDPWIFTLEQLNEEYANLVALYEEYMSESSHAPAFPIGGLGDGSIVFIDTETGAIVGYNADYEELEDVADSFSALMADIAEQHQEILECMD